MRYYQLQESNLEEGGKEFEAAGVEPILPSEVPRVFRLAVSLLPPELQHPERHFQTGSTHAVTSGRAEKLTSSGDMDIMLESEHVAEVFDIKETDPKKRGLAAKRALQQYLIKNAAIHGIPALVTSIYSINVGMALPIDGKKVQVDFEFVRDAHRVHAFHRHSYDTEGFRGMHKQRLLAGIARNTRTPEHPLGMAWSAFEGLKGRVEDPRKPGETKTAGLITNDIGEVAQILLGDHASPDDLDDTNHILAALARNSRDEAEYESRVKDARDEFAKDPKIPSILTYDEALRA